MEFTQSYRNQRRLAWNVFANFVSTTLWFIIKFQNNLKCTCNESFYQVIAIVFGFTTWKWGDKTIAKQIYWCFSLNLQNLQVSFQL